VNGYINLYDAILGIRVSNNSPVDEKRGAVAKEKKTKERGRKAHAVRGNYYFDDLFTFFSSYEGIGRAAQKLNQILHSEFAKNRGGLPLWFVHDTQGQIIRLADNQEVIRKQVAEILADSTENDNWRSDGSKPEGHDIYFEINELIGFLDRNSIPHNFEVTPPEIPISNGDAEDPKWNLMINKPARLRGTLEGPSLINFNRIKELRNGEEETTLTKYLKLGSWTPAMAAMLTCGLQPKVGATEIPKDWATGLWYRGNTKITPHNCSFFKKAEELFELFSYQFPHVSKVIPDEWITWCGEQEIRCNWLTDIPLARAWVLYLEAEAEAKCVNIPPNERWNERWTAPPSCFVEGETRFGEGHKLDSCSALSGQPPKHSLPTAQTLEHPTGSEILTGWKRIQEHLGGVSEKTAKKYAKMGGWLRHTPTNLPTTTTAEIDKWRIESATVRNRNKV